MKHNLHNQSARPNRHIDGAIAAIDDALSGVFPGAPANVTEAEIDRILAWEQTQPSPGDAHSTAPVALEGGFGDGDLVDFDPIAANLLDRGRHDAYAQYMARKDQAHAVIHAASRQIS